MLPLVAYEKLLAIVAVDKTSYNTYAVDKNSYYTTVHMKLADFSLSINCNLM